MFIRDDRESVEEPGDEDEVPIEKKQHRRARHPALPEQFNLLAECYEIFKREEGCKGAETRNGGQTHRMRRDRTQHAPAVPYPQ